MLAIDDGLSLAGQHAGRDCTVLYVRRQSSGVVVDGSKARPATWLVGARRTDWCCHLSSAVEVS